MLLSKYRVWCTTESAWKETEYLSNPPTSCPSNVEHSINVSKSVVIAVEGENVPHAEDLKPYVTPDLFPLGYFMVHAGVGDNIAEGKVGGGASMKMSTSEEGSPSVEVQFIHHVLLAGGSVYREGGKIDDHISMTLIAPETVGTLNSGLGSYNRTEPMPGVGMFMPVGEGNGDWDLDLAETLNPNVEFTKAVPVPSASGSPGFFDYDITLNLLTPNLEGTGDYNLFDVAIPLTCHVNEVPLLGSGKGCTTVPAVKPALCLPHWKFVTTIYHGPGGHLLEAAWKFTIGRRKTL